MTDDSSEYYYVIQFSEIWGIDGLRDSEFRIQEIPEYQVQVVLAKTFLCDRESDLKSGRIRRRVCCLLYFNRWNGSTPGRIIVNRFEL